jgi:hypothetical protein
MLDPHAHSIETPRSRSRAVEASVVELRSVVRSLEPTARRAVVDTLSQTGILADHSDERLGVGDDVHVDRAVECNALPPNVSQRADSDPPSTEMESAEDRIIEGRQDDQDDDGSSYEVEPR